MSVPTIVLVGPPGSGKSTIGRRLSRALSTKLTDTDEMIEQRMGKTCGEVFSELGEPEFRRIEEQVLSLIHISEPTRRLMASRMPSSA